MNKKRPKLSDQAIKVQEDLTTKEIETEPVEPMQTKAIESKNNSVKQKVNKDLETKNIEDFFETDKVEKTAKTVYLDKHLMEEIVSIATKTRRSVNAIICKLIKDRLDQLKK